MKKKPINRKLSVKELEKRTDILMQQLMILQEMVDMVGENFINYVRFKDDEKRFMDFVKSKKERKPKSAKSKTRVKANN